jgi:flagellar basal body-associated protein FliL
MLIIIVVLLVVLLVAAGVGVFFFIRASNAQDQMEVEPPITAIQLDEEDIFDIPLGGAIRTNLARSLDGSAHVISIELSIGINNTVRRESDAMIALVTDKERIVRNVALGVIRRRTIQELERPDGLELLERDILNKLQEQFNTNLIVRVIGSDMFLQ